LFLLSAAAVCGLSLQCQIIRSEYKDRTVGVILFVYDTQVTASTGLTFCDAGSISARAVVRGPAHNIQNLLDGHTLVKDVRQLRVGINEEADQHPALVKSV
jgi:hypothetical protein